MTTDGSKSQIYRDARELGFSRTQAAVLTFQSIDPDEEPMPDKTAAERAEEIEELWAVTPILWKVVVGIVTWLVVAIVIMVML